MKGGTGRCAGKCSLKSLGGWIGSSSASGSIGGVGLDKSALEEGGLVSM